jgi:hypothetical protein
MDVRIRHGFGGIRQVLGIKNKKPEHDLVALDIEGVSYHCLLKLLDTGIAGSGWNARTAHGRHCNHVPGTENPRSLKQYETIGSLRHVS